MGRTEAGAVGNAEAKAGGERISGGSEEIIGMGSTFDDPSDRACC